MPESEPLTPAEREYYGNIIRERHRNSEQGPMLDRIWREVMAERRNQLDE